MLNRLLQAIHEVNPLLILAKRTDFYVSLPVSDQFHLKFDNRWTREEAWIFYLDSIHRRIPLGTIEQIPQLKDYYLAQEDVDESGDLTKNLESYIQNVNFILRIQLHQHTLNWEEKIFCSSDTSVVEMKETDVVVVEVVFNDAKQMLQQCYRYMAELVDNGRISSLTTENRFVLANYRTSQTWCDYSCMFYDGARNSIIVEISGNCVEEVEAPLLPVLSRVVKKQNYLTVGQLGMIRFLLNFQKYWKINNETMQR